MTAVAGGQQDNTTSAVSSNQGGGGDPATASVNVLTAIPLLGPLGIALLADLLALAALLALARGR